MNTEILWWVALGVLVPCSIVLVVSVGYMIRDYFRNKQEEEALPYHYWIGWEDNKTGFRAGTAWLGKNPDDALYSFRCKHPGRRILIISYDWHKVNNRLGFYPWENSNGDTSA